ARSDARGEAFRLQEYHLQRSAEVNDGCVFRPGGELKEEAVMAVKEGAGTLHHQVAADGHVHGDAMAPTKPRPEARGLGLVADTQALVRDLTVRPGDVADLPYASSEFPLILVQRQDEALALLRQIPVAVAIHVQHVAVHDQPDSCFGFSTEYKQAVL